MKDKKPRELSIISTRWKLFAEVAREGSLTRAAAHLDIHQSALSVAIADLERTCGGRLFSRTGRGLVLTALGESILPKVEGLIYDAEQLKEDIRSSASVPSGDVRVGIVASVAQPVTRDLYLKVKKTLPAVRLQVFEGFSGDLDEWLTKGAIDIGIVHRYGRRLAANEERLFQGSSYLVSKARKQQRANEVPFSGLDEIPLILPGRPSGLRSLLDQIAQRMRITIAVAMEANSNTSIKEVVAGSSLCTVLPVQAVYREVEAGTLHAARIVSPAIDRTLALMTTSQHPLSRAARETAMIVRNVVREVVDAGLWER